MDGYIIGIDLGGMSAKGALFDGKGAVVAKKSVETNASDGFEGVAEKLASLSRDLAEEGKNPLFQGGKDRGGGPPASWTAARAPSSNGAITTGRTCLSARSSRL